MSVLVKGMKMPTSCYVCPFMFHERRQPDVWCTATDSNWLDLRETLCGERHSDCPLVEVPAHGRLIDADALKAGLFPEKIGEIKTSINVSCMKLVIDDEPTIIEAEEGE